MKAFTVRSPPTQPSTAPSSSPGIIKASSSWLPTSNAQAQMPSGIQPTATPAFSFRFNAQSPLVPPKSPPAATPPMPLSPLSPMSPQQLLDKTRRSRTRRSVSCDLSSVDSSSVSSVLKQLAEKTVTVSELETAFESAAAKLSKYKRREQNLVERESAVKRSEAERHTEREEMLRMQTILMARVNDMAKQLAQVNGAKAEANKKKSLFGETLFAAFVSPNKSAPNSGNNSAAGSRVVSPALAGRQQEQHIPTLAQTINGQNTSATQSLPTTAASSDEMSSSFLDIDLDDNSTTDVQSLKHIRQLQLIVEQQKRELDILRNATESRLSSGRVGVASSPSASRYQSNDTTLISDLEAALARQDEVIDKLSLEQTELLTRATRAEKELTEITDQYKRMEQSYDAVSIQLEMTNRELDASRVAHGNETDRALRNRMRERQTVSELEVERLEAEVQNQHELIDDLRDIIRKKKEEWLVICIEREEERRLRDEERIKEREERDLREREYEEAREQMLAERNSERDRREAEEREKEKIRRQKEATKLEEMMARARTERESEWAQRDNEWQNKLNIIEKQLLETNIQLTDITTQLSRERNGRDTDRITNETLLNQLRTQHKRDITDLQQQLSDRKAADEERSREYEDLLREQESIIEELRAAIANMNVVTAQRNEALAREEAERIKEAERLETDRRIAEEKREKARADAELAARTAREAEWSARERSWQESEQKWRALQREWEDERRTRVMSEKEREEEDALREQRRIAEVENERKTRAAEQIRFEAFETAERAKLQAELQKRHEEEDQREREWNERFTAEKIARKVEFDRLNEEFKVSLTEEKRKWREDDERREKKRVEEDARREKARQAEDEKRERKRREADEERAAEFAAQEAQWNDERRQLIADMDSLRAAEEDRRIRERRTLEADFERRLTEERRLRRAEIEQIQREKREEDELRTLSQRAEEERREQLWSEREQQYLYERKQAATERLTEKQILREKEIREQRERAEERSRWDEERSHILIERKQWDYEKQQSDKIQSDLIKQINELKLCLTEAAQRREEDEALLVQFIQQAERMRLEEEELAFGEEETGDSEDVREGGVSRNEAEHKSMWNEGVVEGEPGRPSMLDRSVSMSSASAGPSAAAAATPKKKKKGDKKKAAKA